MNPNFKACVVILKLVTFSLLVKLSHSQVVYKAKLGAVAENVH